MALCLILQRGEWMGQMGIPMAPVPPLLLQQYERGMTQKQLAAVLGVDPTTIRDWENGRHRPSRKKRELLVATLVDFGEPLPAAP